MRTAAAVTGLTALTLFGGAAPAHAEAEGDLALDVLETIEVAEDTSMDDYDRDAYAPSGWVDVDGTGMDTRNEILARDLESTEVDDNVVQYGTATGPYSGESIEHVYGDSQVDIEHVVAVGQAHRNGAGEWDDERKQEFYQDQENLIAVDSGLNQAKGADDVTDWMPPNQGAYCEYAAAKVYVKDKYDLTMNHGEHDMIADVLTDQQCEDTEAAPAQAMYTADYDTAPESSDEDSGETAASGDADGLIGDVPNAVLIIGAIIVALGGGAIYSTGLVRPSRRR